MKRKSQAATKGKTDWEAFDGLTDRDVTAAAEADPDALPTDEAFWENARVVVPESKEAISIRLDKDVLEFFRGQRKRGYQTLINAVLRSYMEAHRKS